jgi:hypothetical protein
MRAAFVSAVMIGAIVGCGSPNNANIALRKQNADLQKQVEQLTLERQADAATIRAMESRATTVPVLPNDRLGKLFTTHGLRLGKLTGGWDRDSSAAGHEGLQVYTVPTDQEGDEIKASGSFTIDAFDLSRSSEVRLGHWEFSTDQSSKHWLGNALQYGYIFELPWQTAPTHDEVTVRVTFTDELTGRQFSNQRAIKIQLPLDPTPNQSAQR